MFHEGEKEREGEKKRERERNNGKLMTDGLNKTQFPSIPMKDNICMSEMKLRYCK